MIVKVEKPIVYIQFHISKSISEIHRFDIRNDMFRQTRVSFEYTKDETSLTGYRFHLISLRLPSPLQIQYLNILIKLVSQICYGTSTCCREKYLYIKVLA